MTCDRCEQGKADGWDMYQCVDCQIKSLDNENTKLEAERDRLVEELRSLREYLDAQLAMGREEIKTLTAEIDRLKKDHEETAERWTKALNERDRLEKELKETRGCLGRETHRLIHERDHYRAALEGPPNDDAVDAAIVAFWLAWPSLQQWWVRASPPLDGKKGWETMPPEPFETAIKAYLNALRA